MVNFKSSNLTSYEFPEVSDVFALFNSLPNNSRRYYNILSPINTPLTTQGLFYISRVSADYGKIEYRPLSKSIVYLNTKMAGVWQGWDHITLNADLLKTYYGRIQITTTANSSNALGYVGSKLISEESWYPQNVIALIPISAYLPSDYAVTGMVSEYLNKRLVVTAHKALTFDVNFVILYK